MQLPAPVPRRPDRLVIKAFRVTPARLAADAATARFSFRVDGGAPTVRVRIALTRRGTRTPARTLTLRRRTGRRWSRAVRLKAGELVPGSYLATLDVADSAPRGRRLRARAAHTRVGLRVVAAPRPAPAPPPLAPPPPPPPSAAPAAIGGGIFPVHGPYTLGGEDARFAADRGGRLHRGQDIIAADGTPVVAPRAGTVYWRAYQGGGAGHYLVIRGVDGRDYVFMHLQAASPLAPGTPVAAGTPVGAVGSTGSSSGAHLHFEIWPEGWYSSERSQPIDPLPELRAWAGG